MRKEEVDTLIGAGVHGTAHRRNYTPYVAVFLTALVARALFLILVDDPILFTKYPYFAEKMAAGEDIGDRLVDLSPFYLYFLVLFKKILNVDWHGLKIVQSLLGTVNCLLVLAVGTRAFGRRVGVVAALLFALYGNMMVLESTLEPTVFVLFFNLVTVFLLLDPTVRSASERRLWMIFLGAGFFAGISAITKPNFLLFFPIAALYLLFFGGIHRPFLKRVGYVVIFSLAGCAVIATVSVRNYMAIQDFVLITADAGKVFFHGSGKGATALEGTGLVDEGFSQEGAEEPDYAHVLYRKKAEARTGKELKPSESSKFWLKRTLNGIAEDPVSYVKLEIKKLLYFFNDYEMHYIASAYQEYKRLLAVPLVRYGMISCLAIIGMGLCVVRPGRAFLIFGIVAVYLAACMLFLVQSRYRTPAVPYLCMFAGYTVVVLKNMITAKRFEYLVVLLLALAVSCGFTHLPFRGEIGDVDKWQQATKIHYEMAGRPLFNRGKYDEAIEEMNKAIALVPRFAPAYNLRGKAYAILGKHDRAAHDFSTVITLSPQQAKGYKNLGFLVLLQGQEEAAVAHLSKALSLAPEDEKVKAALEKLKER